MKYQPSSANNPCPVCRRGDPNSGKLDGDCRILEHENVVLCHSHQDKSPDINGYHWLRRSDKGAGWGVWVWAEQSSSGKIIGRKIRPQQEKRQYFEYPDRDGNALIRVVRQKGSPIEFYQEYWVNNQWIPASKVDDDIKAAMRQSVPIYRYHEVRAAVERGDPVFWAEGEASVDALWSIGIAATTSIGGSKGYRSWGKYKDDLRGAKIVLCPDRDKEGIAYIDEVAKDFPDHQIYRAFKSSPVWEFLPDAGGLDVADEIADGVSAEVILKAVVAVDAEKPKTLGYHEVLDIVDKLEEQYPDEQELDWHLRDFVHENNLKSKGYSSGSLLKMARARRDGEQSIEIMDAIDILESVEEGREWVIAGMIPRGSTVVLAAQGGAGKTSLSYNFAKHVALGQSWSGFPVTQGPVLIVQADEPLVDIRDKLDVGRFFDVPKGLVHFITKWRFSQIRQLEALIKKIRPVLIIIDSYTAAHAGTGIELTKSYAGDNIYTLRDIAQLYNCSFLIIHHHNKMNGLRDSSTINDNASEIWSLGKDDKVSAERHHFVLDITKSRAGIAGRYLLQRNPIDYSWSHLGTADGTQGHLSKIIEHLDSCYTKTFSSSQLADDLDLPRYEVAETLEQGRRLGLIQGQWVQWTRSDGSEDRFRVYCSRSYVVENAVEVTASAVNQSVYEEF